MKYFLLLLALCSWLDAASALPEPLLSLRDGVVTGDNLPAFTPQKLPPPAADFKAQANLLQDHYLRAEAAVPLTLTPEGITFACRFHAQGGTLPEGTLFAWKNKQQVFTAFMLSFNGIKGIGALLDSGRTGPKETQRKFVFMPIWEFDPFDESGWHTLIVRHRGALLDLYVDGAHRDRHGPKDRASPFGTGNQWFPLDSGSFTAIGADPDGSYHYPGGIDQLSLWTSALSDSSLSTIFDEEILMPNWDRDARDHYLPKDMTEDDWFVWMDQLAEKDLRRSVNEDPYFPQFHVTGQGDTCNHTLLHDGESLHLFPGGQSFWWWSLLPLNRSATGWFDQHFQTSDYLTWQRKPMTRHHGVNGGAEMIDGRITKVHTFYNRAKHESTFYQFSALDVDKRQWQLTTSTIPGQPGLKTGVRDCDVFQHDGWYYLVGANHWTAGDDGAFQKGKNTRYLLHKSRDLKTWQVAGDGTFWDTGSNMTTECPSVNMVDGRCVMLGCQNLIGDAHYAVGEFKSERFHLKKSGQVDVGNSAAVHSWMTQDDRGRWILTTWIRGSNMGGKIDLLTGLKPRFQSGWHNIYSLPRQVTIKPDDSLHFEPLDDLMKLRLDPASLTDQSLSGITPIPAKPGAHFEIDAEWTVAAGVSTGIRLKQGGEHIDILHTPDDGGTLVIDTSGAKHALVALDKIIRRPLPRQAGHPLQLRVFFDGCLLEAYADDGQVTTARWYAADPSQITSHVLSQNGATPIQSIHHYPMRSIWTSYQTAKLPEAKP